MGYHFKNTGEILGMGGPWCGDFYFGEILIQERVIENYLVRKGKVFYVKYHNAKWRSEVFFTINFYDKKTSTLWEFDKKFDSVYLKKFLNEIDLEIYLAFHDKTKEVLIFNTSEEKLHCLGHLHAKN